MILHGDCLDVLKTLDAESIDACVTDPPYGLEFMGKDWDKLGAIVESRTDDTPKWRSGSGVVNTGDAGPFGANGQRVRYGSSAASAQEWHRQWAVEVYRVLKPGAHLLACGGTRTYHRLTCAIEDAGFEIRDCLAWLYGSGFPKSLNLGEGLGTALKPAHEPIVLARKPFKGSVKANVAQHGTGALNIDACRIAFDGDAPQGSGTRTQSPVGFTDPSTRASLGNGGNETSPLGRWPPNVACDDLAAMVIDEQSGETTSTGGQASLSAFRNGDIYGKGRDEREARDPGYGDICGASRFFFCAKSSREERDMGCYDLDPRQRDESRKDGNPGGDNPRNRGLQKRGNHHPTVKPVELMRWLVRLVTPLNGIVLDPFLGSGTTGMAARYEQRQFIGIEREAEYIAIAERRIAAVAPLFVVPVADAPREVIVQSDLFTDSQ